MLSQISNKNHEHFDHVFSRLQELKKVREKAQQERIIKLFEEKKRKDKVLKQVMSRNGRGYQSISMYRNREMTYDEVSNKGNTPRYMRSKSVTSYTKLIAPGKIKSVKELNAKIYKSEQRLRKQKEERDKNINFKRELQHLKEENSKKMYEKYRMLEKLKKEEIMLKLGKPKTFY